MLVGMIVVHEGRAKAVRSIRGAAPSYTERHPVTYGLQDWETNDVKYVRDPQAEDIPLLPRCPQCGQGVAPGHYGAPGWLCDPACQVTLAERAALLTAREDGGDRG